MFLLGEINKIFELGVQLGIDVSTLRRLLGKYQYDSVDMRMIEVIDFWLKNSRDCSWDVLAKAVTRIGGHDQLAKKLKQIGKGQEAGMLFVFNYLKAGIQKLHVLYLVHWQLAVLEFQL